jgi:hypothetical protein
MQPINVLVKGVAERSNWVADLILFSPLLGLLVACKAEYHIRRREALGGTLHLGKQCTLYSVKVRRPDEMCVVLVSLQHNSSSIFPMFHNDY